MTVPHLFFAVSLKAYFLGKASGEKKSEPVVQREEEAFSTNLEPNLRS